MKLPTLYKMSQTGAIQEWDIECWKQNNCAIYTVSHGQVGGAKQHKTTLVKSGKNTGKANETSVWEQAQLEAQSKWQKQIDRRGYSEAIPTQKPFGPMLAHSYDKYPHKIRWPCYWQPKLDGIRCVVTLENGAAKLTSRQGKEFTALPHINEAAETLLKKSPHIILDGELYRHGDEFQDLVSSIKRDKPSEQSKSVQLHVYDIVDDKLPFIDRFNIFFGLIPQTFPSAKRVIDSVWTQTIDNVSSLHTIHKQQTQRGYEGIMLRNTNGMYKIGGRSYDLLKYKVFQDQEFKITNAFENAKMPGTCVFECATDKGYTFKVMPEGDMEYRELLWCNWQSGNIKPNDKMTVKFFAWTTSDKPVPRFPVGRLRNYE